MSPNRATLSLVFAAVCACGGVRALEPSRAQPRAVANGKSRTPGNPERVLRPSRLFPPAAPDEVAAEALEPDGSRRFVAQGLRVIERPDGSLEAADVWLPMARNLRALPLPERFGGGFLFVVQTGGSTLLYAASSWTGRLRPIARLDGDVEQIVPGFDRIYAMLGRGSHWIALDAATGQGVDLGSLPRSAGYGHMAFADEWFAVVLAPFRGALATFDAGGTWHPLGMFATPLSVLDGGVVLSAGGSRFVLDSNGRVLPVDPAESGPAKRAPLPDAAAGPQALANQRPLGPRPLETAVLYGVAESNDTALVAAGGVLARVRLADGAVVEKHDQAYPGVSPCAAVPLGDGAGFVCGEPGGGTLVYEYQRPLALRARAEFADARRVAPSGNGALVVEGGCDSRAERSLYCIFPRAGAPFEVAAREPGVERVVALASGAVARLLPPRLGRAGELGVLAGSGSERRRELELPKLGDKVGLAVVRDGLWLDSFQEGPEGELRGWVAAGGTFVGIKVKPDGKVLVGPPQQYLDRALLSGSYGLVVTRAGAALETVDGGFEWTDAELPSEPEWRAQHTTGAAHGCTPLGCAFSGWLRVGWGMGSRGRLLVAAPPESSRVRLPSGNRWSLDCVPAGDSSRPALALPEVDDARDDIRPSPLAEVAPPDRPSSDRMFDAGSEPELRAFRAYAWGPPAEAWPRAARWMLRVTDPFSVSGGVWSTTPTPVPWNSPEAAADAFGRSASGPPASYRLITDPMSHAGLLVMNARGSSELFLLEEGRDIVRLKTAGAVGVVSSFARSGRSSYVGALGEGQTLRVYRVEASTLVLVGEYADVQPRAELPRLAPATRSDGIGLWVRGGHHYLYPLDPNSGRLDAPIEISAESLAAMPRACNSEEDGYVVGDALSLAPRIDLYGAPVQAGNGIEVRLVVSSDDVCVDGIAAPVGGGAERTAAPPDARAQSGAPMVLTDPRPGGTRRAFRCWD